MKRIIDPGAERPTPAAALAAMFLTLKSRRQMVFTVERTKDEAGNIIWSVNDGEHFHYFLLEQYEEAKAYCEELNELHSYGGHHLPIRRFARDLRDAPRDPGRAS